MSKIYVPIGVSGSGKSTWAKSFIGLDDVAKTVIVSRDSIRMSLFGLDNTSYNEYYSDSPDAINKKENMVSNFFDNQVWYALQKGYDVIADNTHLNKKYINHYKMFGVHIDPVIFDVGFETACGRDMGRDKNIGSDIISSQYQKFASLMKSNFMDEIGEYNKTVDSINENSAKIPHDVKKPNAVLFDIDGTLAIKGDRDIHDLSRVDVDKPNHPVLYARNAIAYRNKRVDSYGEIIICSGREEVCRKQTEDWLAFHKQDYKKLYMRAKGDNRKDWIIKAEFWAEIQKDYNIVAMFDDRDQVVRIGRRLGYSMFQVNYGDF